MRCLLPFLFLSFTAAAQSQKPLVVYIGGAQASQPQVDCWKAGAEKTSGGKYEFLAYPYPLGVTLNHGSDKQENGKKLVEQMAKAISAQNPNRSLIIVGHSSGSDLANALAVKVHQSGRSITRLIDLDGYGVPAEVSKDIPTTCVTAEDPTSGLHSPYWKEAHEKCGGREIREMKFSGCGSSPLCLHFRMTNKSASPSLNGSNYGSDGYTGCAANLDWLTAGGAAAAPAATGTSQK